MAPTAAVDDDTRLGPRRPHRVEQDRPHTIDEHIRRPWLAGGVEGAGGVDELHRKGAGCVFADGVVDDHGHDVDRVREDGDDSGRGGQLRSGRPAPVAALAVARHAGPLRGHHCAAGQTDAPSDGPQRPPAVPPRHRSAPAGAGRALATIPTGLVARRVIGATPTGITLRRPTVAARGTTCSAYDPRPMVAERTEPSVGVTRRRALAGSPTVVPPGRSTANDSGLARRAFAMGANRRLAGGRRSTTTGSGFGETAAGIDCRSSASEPN